MPMQNLSHINYLRRRFNLQSTYGRPAASQFLEFSTRKSKSSSLKLPAWNLHATEISTMIKTITCEKLSLRETTSSSPWQKALWTLTSSADHINGRSTQVACTHHHASSLTPSYPQIFSTWNFRHESLTLRVTLPPPTASPRSQSQELGWGSRGRGGRKLYQGLPN